MREIGPKEDLGHAAGMHEYQKENPFKSTDKIGKIIKFPKKQFFRKNFSFHLKPTNPVK